MGGRGRGIGALWWERGGRTGTLGRGKPRPLKWPAITDEAATLEGAITPMKSRWTFSWMSGLNPLQNSQINVKKHFEINSKINM